MFDVSYSACIKNKIIMRSVINGFKTEELDQSQRTIRGGHTRYYSFEIICTVKLHGDTHCLPFYVSLRPFFLYYFERLNLYLIMILEKNIERFICLK